MLINLQAFWLGPWVRLGARCVTSLTATPQRSYSRDWIDGTHRSPSTTVTKALCPQAQQTIKALLPNPFTVREGNRPVRRFSANIICRQILAFHLRLLMSQIIWKLSLMVSSRPHDRLEFMPAMAQPPHLGDEGNLVGYTPACCGRKSLSLATVQDREGFLSPPGAQDLRADVFRQASELPAEAPGLEPRATHNQSPAGLGIGTPTMM